MFAAMLGTDYAKKDIFKANMMADWRPLLRKTDEGKQVKDLAKCDFSAIVDHLAELQAAKKELTAAQKKELKAAKDELEAPFHYALVDGVKEKVGNFRVEPPGLFRGRGEHPKMGKLKKRIVPEDIVINLGRKAKVPTVPDIGDGIKHKWGGIEHKNTVTWLAKWKDSINGEDKSVWLAANSTWKGKSDMAKYEKARELKKHISKVRNDYTEGFKSAEAEIQQRAVAVYMIDKLALRVGNEKNTEEEADTVGCCSLRVEHVKMEDANANQLHLNFLGKDSIVYDNTTDILPAVYKLIKTFMKGKKPDQELFDLVAPEDLNEYFKSVMDGLSAKVFRTYNASITLCSELQKTSDMVTKQQREKEGDINALYNYYQIANKNVAELCNHQRATPASHAASLVKMDEKIAAVRAEVAEAEKAKNAAKAEKLALRVVKMEAERRTKDETKNVSLGTSKINYNDPRITIAWCKHHDVPISKPFPKTLLSKFAWAMGTSPEFRF
jgi:DNA topoisomerase-1